MDNNLESKKNVIEIIIECSKGSKNKYETTDEGKIKLDRILAGSNVFPENYGFIPETLASDNDPLDIVVISSGEPIIPGCLVEVRVIGLLEMEDSGEQDDKVIAVVNSDRTFEEVTDIKKLNKSIKMRIKDFFSNYKQIENKKVLVGDFLGKEQA